MSEQVSKPKIVVCIPRAGIFFTEFAAFTLASLVAKSDWCDMKSF
jgi:hypothetical protein